VLGLAPKIMLHLVEAVRP